MADKMATRQDVKTIGGKGEADNKLITYQEISDYGCRIIGSAQYENNQCVALKDLQAATSSISGSLTCTLMGEMRVFIVNISGGGVSYNYGPSGKWWDYYTSIPNNYIKAGSTITVNAECAHNGTSHQSEVLFTLSTAFWTLLPIYFDLSPSLSSSASKIPVEAPDGTAARPFTPFVSFTSTSTVGLPRESKICLA